MNYENPTRAYSSRRSAVVPIAFLTSLFTSLIVTVVILWLSGNLQSAKLNQSGESEDLRKVPAVVGLTLGVAGDVLRTRDLRLVVQE